MIGRAIAFLAAALCAACTPTRAVELRVTRTDGGAPVAGAHVRVIPLDAGLVPLPLDASTLAEIGYAGRPTGAVTDDDGRARLDLLDDRPSVVEVASPFLEPPGRWRWILDPDALALEPDPDTSERPYALAIDR